MKNKIAIFPGSFDPITKGHKSIIERATQIFDEIIIAIGINANKNTLFSLEDRKNMLEKSFHNNPKVKIASFDGLTVDFCKEHNANYIIRGLRNSADFEYEKTIHEVNTLLYPELETVLLFSEPKYGVITSSLVREIISHKGDISEFVPKEILKEVNSKTK
ncbi:MAG: pantetheine-phosphate adenylyltransferase [Bacteroidales bacterium]